MATNRVRRRGSYAPLSAHYYKDDAVLRAGERAEVLYTRGLAFCADVLSDGFISDLQLTNFVAVGLPGAAKRAEALVREGLWWRDSDAGGWWVTNWLEWNKSRADIEDAMKQDRVRKGRNDDDM